MWSSTVEPFGTCPDCEQDDKVLNRWNDAQEYVCSDCSEREPNYEPATDDNYTASDLAPAALDQIIADCAKFQRDQQDLIVSEYCTLEVDKIDSQAGYDFWLTRNRHGAGFWDGDWDAEAGKVLTAASHVFGECSLYVGDDGKLYLFAG